MDKRKVAAMGFFNDVLRDIGKSIASGAKDVGSDLWDHVKADARHKRDDLVERGRRSLRNSFVPPSVPRDIQTILDGTPDDEEPEIPLRPDTEAFMVTDFGHLSERDLDERGRAPGYVGDRRIAIRIPLEVIRTVMGDHVASRIRRDPGAERRDRMRVVEMVYGHRFQGTRCVRCSRTLALAEKSFCKDA